MDRPQTMTEAKRQAIVTALHYTAGDKVAAAALLEIGYGTLYRKLREFEIMPTEYMYTRGHAVGEV